jgi:hypothetical protein
MTSIANLAWRYHVISIEIHLVSQYTAPMNNSQPASIEADNLKPGRETRLEPPVAVVLIPTIDG